MAKKVLTLIKLQIPGGQANPAPPVGPALGQHGVNIMEFCKAFNAQTAQENGRITPSRSRSSRTGSFDFITEDAAGRRPDQGGAAAWRRAREPNREKVGRLTRDQLRSIAETKMPDLNARERRGGDEGRRRHRTLDGRGDRSGMSSTARTTATPGAQIDREQLYSPVEAIRMLKSFPAAKFDEVRSRCT
jgi:large subunit ribosomal protein L11